MTQYELDLLERIILALRKHWKHSSTCVASATHESRECNCGKLDMVRKARVMWRAGHVKEA